MAVSSFQAIPAVYMMHFGRSTSSRSPSWTADRVHCDYGMCCTVALSQTQRKKVVPNREERITDRLGMSKHGPGSGNYWDICTCSCFLFTDIVIAIRIKVRSGAGWLCMPEHSIWLSCFNSAVVQRAIWRMDTRRHLRLTNVTTQSSGKFNVNRVWSRAFIACLCWTGSNHLDGTEGSSKCMILHASIGISRTITHSWLAKRQDVPSIEESHAKRQINRPDWA